MRRILPCPHFLSSHQTSVSSKPSRQINLLAKQRHFLSEDKTYLYSHVDSRQYPGVFQLELTVKSYYITHLEHLAPQAPDFQGVLGGESIYNEAPVL